MTTREQLTALVEKLPEDKLQLAFERLEPLAEKPAHPDDVPFVVRLLS